MSKFALSQLTFQELREANVKRCVTGFGHSLDSWSVAEWTNAAAGEMGEACNIAKKLIRFRNAVKGNTPGKSVDDYRAELARELADALIYIDLTCASQGIDLEAALIDTFNNKSVEIGSEVLL